MTNVQSMEELTSDFNVPYVKMNIFQITEFDYY